MECHKSRVLRVFLERTGKTMQGCIKEMEGDAEELMDAYSSLDRKWINNDPHEKFLGMMITDGCFMLETMAYHYINGVDHAEDVEDFFKNHYDEKKDPIFSAHGYLNMMPFIRRDMLLLENQLPFPLLAKLISLGGRQNLKDGAVKESKAKPTASSSCMDKPTAASVTHDKDRLIQDPTGHEYIIKLIVTFCSPFNKPVYQYEKLRNSKHALDIHRKLLISGTVPKKLSPWSKWCEDLAKSNDRRFSKKITPEDLDDGIAEYGENIIPSANWLRESGISIRKSRTKSITDIQFYAGLLGGVLEMPELVADDDTEPVFRNLMAFERLHPETGHDVTSYVIFMDDIIDNAQDVKILHGHGILSNAYGSDMAVANLFNSLTKDATVDPNNNLVTVRYKARRHCMRAWNKHWGDLIHTYFNNPWTAIAVVAAILAFALGIIDTISNIKDKAKRNGTPPPPPPAN